VLYTVGTIVFGHLVKMVFYLHDDVLDLTLSLLMM